MVYVLIILLFFGLFLLFVYFVHIQQQKIFYYKHRSYLLDYYEQAFNIKTGELECRYVLHDIKTGKLILADPDTFNNHFIPYKKYNEK